METISPQGPEWPKHGSSRVLFLLDAASGLDEKLLRDWIERQRPASLRPADGPPRLKRSESPALDALAKDGEPAR